MFGVQLELTDAVGLAKLRFGFATWRSPGETHPKTGSRNRSKSEAVWTGLPSCWTCAACNLPSCVAQDRKVEVVARTLRSQLRRSAGGWPSADSCWTCAACHHASRKTAKSKWLQEHSARNCAAAQVELVCLQHAAQSGPHFGARNVAPKRGAAEALGAGGACFWGRFLDPKMGAAFCVTNIAEAECATHEHVSARKRACPKLLVVGCSLCSALVPKGWPSADSCWTCAACNLPSCVAQDRKVEVVARTLRPQLWRFRRWSSFVCNMQRKAAPILGPGMWPPKGGPPKLLVILLKNWGRRGSFLGPLFGPQNGGRFLR